nr:zinc knuckle CX2CX4HX4C [Tanacetum cinerariifolium]GEZ06733.1 zinc knuckle CX2CX4HX4C [Tanacetum cinerariifolium]
TIKNKAAVEGKGKGIESDQPKTSNSYVSALKNKHVNKVVKVTEIRNDKLVDGAAVAIPFEAMEEVSSRFRNTLYGYFIGKRLAFRLVENYVKIHGQSMV